MRSDFSHAASMHIPLWPGNTVRLIILLMMSFLFFACKKTKPEPAEDFFLRVSQTTVELGGPGDEKEIQVEANSSWKITFPQGTDWIQLDKSGGQANGTVKIKAIKNNQSGNSRNITLTVSLDNGKAGPKQISVKQDPEAIELSIAWKKVLGGSGNDMSYAITPTSDGGSIVTARTTSNNNGDVGSTKGGIDMWVVKLNEAGSVVWQKTLGGSSDEVGGAVAETTDGGYVITGYTISNNTGDVGPNHGGIDYWVVKLDQAGTIQWKKTLGGNGDEWPHAIAVTSEGRIAVAGYTKSNNSGDVGAGKGSEDFWVVLLENANGNLIWQKTIGGQGSDIARTIVPDANGGLIVGGTTTSNQSGDVPSTKGASDYFIVQLDKQGNMGWKTTLGGNNLEELFSLAISGNTLIATGSTKSNNGDVTASKGGEDFWVVSLHAGTGAVNWKKNYGGSGADVARSALINPDGSIVVAGYSHSQNSGDIGSANGAGDYWVIGLDASGKLLWNRLLGGDDEDLAFGIAKAGNNAWIVTGYTHSHNSGDVENGHGNTDVWVVKLAR